MHIRHPGSSAGRGPSPQLLARVKPIWENPVGMADKGFHIWDDFLELPTGRWTATQATSGTFTLKDQINGVAAANSGAATNTQGINVQRAGSTGELFLPAAGRRILYETRVMFSAALASGLEMYLGLAPIDTTIIGSGAETLANGLGFYSVTADGVVLFRAEKSSTALNNTIFTLANDTWYKLGFIVYGTRLVEVYKDGLLIATTAISNSYIPVTDMVPSIVCQSNGTTQPIIDTDWILAVQSDED